MVQPWVPMLWHQDQSWLLIIDVLGDTAPRKAAPYDQTRGGEGSVELGPGFHSKLHMGLRPLTDKHRDSDDSAILRPSFLQASALLCQLQRPPKARDKWMINLTATAL